MTNELVALLDGNEIGRVRNDARSRLTFVYDNNWREARGHVPARCLRAWSRCHWSLPVGASPGQRARAQSMGEEISGIGTQCLCPHLLRRPRLPRRRPVRHTRSPGGLDGEELAAAERALLEYGTQAESGCSIRRSMAAFLNRICKNRPLRLYGVTA